MERSSAAPPVDRTFSGTPRRYRTLALAIGFGSHAYLYAGLFIIEYVWHQRAWILGWKPIVVTALSALSYTALCMRTFTSLDRARVRGTRARPVVHAKLPEER